MLYDVVIIGGGPAGLTAGLYSARARLETILVEKALYGGQVMTTERIENYPGFDEGISGPELAMRMERHAKRFGLEVVKGTVIGVSFNDKIKEVRLEDGGIYKGKTVIISTGARPRSLNIDGEERLRGRGVSYCATCDGAFFSGERVAVVGGGDSAVEEGIFLTRFADEVYIIHRRDELRATKVLQERASSNPKIRFILDTLVERIEGEDSVKALHLRNVKSNERSILDVRGVFIYIGYRPNTDIFKGIVNLDEDGYIITDEDMATSVSGVFAAGDVRAKSLKQIATAIGDGAIAAVSAERYIEENF
ncbi:MAG: thioredoxin-disulfide reductase [Thermodesulfovibrionia bacterium]